MQVGNGTSPATRAYIYETNFGDPAARNERFEYSRFEYFFPLVRKGWEYYSRLPIGLHVAVLIALLALWIRPTDTDPRFALGTAGLFVTVASEFIVTASLPDTSHLTLVDKLHMVGLAFIFLLLVESVVSLRLARSQVSADFARRLDRWSFVVLLMLYLAASVFLVAEARSR